MPAAQSLRPLGTEGCEVVVCLLQPSSQGRDAPGLLGEVCWESRVGVRGPG